MPGTSTTIVAGKDTDVAAEIERAILSAPPRARQITATLSWRGRVVKLGIDLEAGAVRAHDSAGKDITAELLGVKSG